MLRRCWELCKILVSARNGAPFFEKNGAGICGPGPSEAVYTDFLGKDPHLHDLVSRHQRNLVT
jgi:hypothetical protein